MYNLLTGNVKCVASCHMEFAGEEFALLPATTGVPPARDKKKAKDPKVWLAGELIIRCEHQGLTSLPQQLFLKTTVRKLILTGNELVSVPPELFEHLRELRELGLGHNQLTYLPEEVQLLQHLETLDVQHNQLKLVPASLYKCVRLSVINLNGNPLCSWLRELWPEAPAPQASGGSDSSPTAAGCSSRAKDAAALQQLNVNTQALLQHLLEAQEPDVRQQAQQARLAVLQEASRARLKKLLHHFDSDRLAECRNLAMTAHLGEDVLQQIQQVQEAAEALQAAAEAVLQHQQQQPHQTASEGVPADLQQQLGASLRHAEELCKPGKPAGMLYTSAHDLLRKLQRQQQERGWRCATGRAAAAGQAEDAAVSEGMNAAGASESLDAAGAEGLSSPVGPRRFLTSAERTRQQLAAQGAKTYKEWALQKKQQQEREKQLIKDMSKADSERRMKASADQLALSVEYYEREKQWPSKRSEAYPPGTFSPSPEALKAVRKAYHKPPSLE